ncbi:hypothetical protein [Streptomyces hilarionis]|uniref:hypothetical protein n=1 Tax=Streptomyces hilarionis TaxID=2839954 RepID=UPI00211A1DFC|nr:hypothetical protein [Streptomyces hilarionis]
MFDGPTDHLTHSWPARAPLAVQDRGLHLLLRLSRGRLAEHDLPEPEDRVAAHPTVSDDLLSRSGHGEVTVKPMPSRIDATQVAFNGGSMEGIDTIICCARNDIVFPFLADEVIDVRRGQPGRLWSP